MTLSTFPTTVTRKNAAVTLDLPIHSTEPGVINVTYPTGITGPATVTVAGTRTWRMRQPWRDGWNGSDALAALTEARDGVTICFDVNAQDLTNQNLGSAITNIYPIAQCYSKGTTTNQFNWLIGINYQRPTADLYRLLYQQTIAPQTAGAALYVRNMSKFTGLCRVVVTLNSTIVTVYWHDGATKQSGAVARTAPTGTVSNPCLAIYGAARFAYFASILGNNASGVDAWLAGNCPASPVVYYPCNEEVPDTITAAPYDASGNDRDGVFNIDTTYPLTKAPRVFSDTTPVVPATVIPITVAADAAAGDYTISLSRTRVGVPSRASDAEKYETASAVVTVAVTAEAVTIGPDINCQVPSYPAAFDLLLTGNYDGSATVVSDDPNLVPASPVTISGGVAVVACTVAADVTGATVTATGPGGDTDACSVTVALVPEEIVPIKIGPSQTLRPGVTSIYLHITGEDGACTVTASPVVGLSGVPATVTIASGEADLTLTKMSAGTYTITATQGALSDTCTIIVPVGFTAATEYDLVQDVADMIETYGVGYHYDPELLTDTGGDLEDRMFTVRETGVVDGPMIGGKTVTIAVDAYYCNRVPSSDAKALIDYLNCEADAPSYVHALFATGGMVIEEQGAQKITYEIQVSLG